MTREQLPIELLNFEIVKNESKINIQWSTASETNNDYFSVEKSKNSFDWTVVKIIPGAGNSTVTKKYETVDAEPYSGISYYRLKQTDYDGKFSYPAIKSIMNEAQPVFNIYPNPAIDQVTIEYENNGKYEISLSRISEIKHRSQFQSKPEKQYCTHQNSDKEFTSYLSTKRMK